MALILAANVGEGIFNAGDTDAEGAVSFLPAKVSMFGKGFMNPLR